MVRDTVREKNIQSLLLMVLDPKGANVEAAFESLCLYFRDGDIDFIYKALTERGDNQSAYWLVNYLVAVERPYGFNKLFSLAADRKEFIRQHASAGISRIDPSYRIELLEKMLDFVWEKQVSFAAHQSNTLLPELPSAPYRGYGRFL